MNKYILLLTLISSNSVFADCLFPKYMVDMAQQTGGEISCQDKEYYQNKDEIDKLNRVGLKGNCISKGEDLFCKSGTSIKYKSPNEIKFEQEQKHKMDTLQVKTLQPFIKLPMPVFFKPPINWNKSLFNQPTAQCFVKIWDKKQLSYPIIYQTAEQGLHANLEGLDISGFSYAQRVDNFNKELVQKEFIKPEFITEIMFSDYENKLYLYSKKGGSCKELNTQECIRAEGILVQPKIYNPSQNWRLPNPIEVVIEDSCAKNGYFLDARPFWKKIPLPH